MQLAIVAGQLGRPCSAQALEDDWHALQFRPSEAAVWMRAPGGSPVGLLLQFTWCGQEVLQLAHAARSAGYSSLQAGLFSLLLAHITGGSQEHPLAALSFSNMQFTGDGLQFVLVAVDAIPAAV